MDAIARIALVWQSTTAVEGLCRVLSAAWPSTQLSLFTDVAADADAVRRLRPQALIVGDDAPGDELAGSLRLLCALLPGTGLVLATPGAGADAGTRITRRLGGALLVLPADAAAVTAALGAARRAEAASEPQAMLSLTRGIADEVNNPLLAALGHLRLLENDLAGDESKLAKVKAASRSLRRIQSTIDRTRELQRSGDLGERRGTLLPVDIGGLLGELLPGSTFPQTFVLGDRDLLRVALRDLGVVGRDLAGDGPAPAYRIVRLDGDTAVSMDVAAPRLAAWQLPRTFEPYYLSRMLRGTSHGLSLFAVQQIVAAHGGVARARRRPDGGVGFELLLPSVP